MGGEETPPYLGQVRSKRCIYELPFLSLSPSRARLLFWFAAARRRHPQTSPRAVNRWVERGLGGEGEGGRLQTPKQESALSAGGL